MTSLAQAAERVCGARCVTFTLACVDYDLSRHVNLLSQHHTNMTWGLSSAVKFSTWWVDGATKSRMRETSRFFASRISRFS